MKKIRIPIRCKGMQIEIQEGIEKGEDARVIRGNKGNAEMEGGEEDKEEI